VLSVMCMIGYPMGKGDSEVISPVDILEGLSIRDKGKDKKAWRTNKEW